MATVTLQGVRKSFGRTEVIPPLDLEIDRRPAHDRDVELVVA